MAAVTLYKLDKPVGKISYENGQWTLQPPNDPLLTELMNEEILYQDERLTAADEEGFLLALCSQYRSPYFRVLPDFDEAPAPAR